MIQANHPKTDATRPVQVASIQTLQRRAIPRFDIVVIDEAHRWFEMLGVWMRAPDWASVPFVGLSATPWTKGLGKFYDDLVQVTTTAELIEAGYLSPFRVYAPSHPDLSGVRTVAGDYHEGDLGEAAVEGALSQLDAPKELSSTETELSRIQGTAAGLNQVLKDLGFSADDTAKIINVRTIKALDALKDKFNDDLGRKINDAQNKGYLNDAADLIKEVAGLRADATAVGGDLGQVDTYFTAAAQKLVDGSQLVGSAFNDLIAKFPELQGKVHEYSETASMSADQAAKAAAQALSEIQDRKRGYEDRAFAVNFSDNSLSTKLTAFDRTAEWDQWTEMAKGGQALDDLIATQVLERNKLIADYNAAVKERQLTFQDRTFAATNDTTTLAGQLAEYDRKATQERLDEVKAGGDAIADLEQAQGAERLKIINDFAKQATDALNARLKGYADRYFTATNDSTTLGGQLDAYDRQALQEREDEIKAGGEAMAELEQTQAAERLKIISDYGKQAADALKQHPSSLRPSRGAHLRP